VLARSATAFAPASIIAASLTSVVSTNPASGANVDSPVTDAVTQANVKVLASSPAMSMGSVYQSMAHSVGLQLNDSPGLVTPAQLITTCLVARMEATSGVDVEGVAWVIQDAPTEISSPIFEVDLYVQRLP